MVGGPWAASCNEDRHKAMMAQLRPPVLLVLPGSHGQAASRVPWPSDLWAATGW